MAQGDILITIIGNLTGDPELRFTPSGFHTNTGYEPGKTVIVIETPQATIAF